MRRIITFIKDKFADFKASIKRKQIKMKNHNQGGFHSQQPAYCRTA
ncbi:MAG: hypothetical protein L6V87_02100 [Ruminococcus sp.]|nr:MAG: hypothetical protein L6V87_02100 [Ruminococcus sp.]